jgi:hypothetical protein
VKRQTIAMLASPSIAESMPNPIRAGDPATMRGDDGDRALEAPIRELAQERSFARPARRRYSRWGSAVSRGGDGSSKAVAVGGAVRASMGAFEATAQQPGRDAARIRRWPTRATRTITVS